MLPDLPRPVIFAHRGASALAPENTLAAFKLALAEGTDAIEVDVKLSADEELVVIHDPTVDRTTNGHGRVSRMKLRDLRSLDAGSSFSEKFGGEKIPMLAEVLEMVGRNKLVNIELTNYATPNDPLVEKVCHLIKKHAVEKSIFLSSFLAPNLSKAARLVPVVPRGLLALPGWKGAWARSFGLSFGAYAALHPYFTDVTPRQVQRVHRLKRRIHVWTVNDPEALTRLHGWGVDGIFTDHPGLALQKIGRKV